MWLEAFSPARKMLVMSVPTRYASSVSAVVSGVKHCRSSLGLSSQPPQQVSPDAWLEPIQDSSDMELSNTARPTLGAIRGV